MRGHFSGRVKVASTKMYKDAAHVCLLLIIANSVLSAQSPSFLPSTSPTSTPPSLPSDLLRGDNNDTLCIPYPVDTNECAEYLAGYTTPARDDGAPLPLLFQECIAETLSSIRMFGGFTELRECRRRLISVLCHIVLPPCATPMNKTDSRMTSTQHLSSSSSSRSTTTATNSTVLQLCESDFLQTVAVCQRALGDISTGRMRPSDISL